MKHKLMTFLSTIIVVFLMILAAYFTTKFGGHITGAIPKKCGCTSNDSCNDNDPCTEDICLYPEDCAASRCIHVEKEECRR